MKLPKGREIFIQWYNEWKQFGSKFNWYTFNFITVELEHDKSTAGLEITVILLGLGFRIRYSYMPFDQSPVGKEILSYPQKTR